MLELILIAALSEADYVNQHCLGVTEYVLEDRTRVDCLTGHYAIEYDYASKWYQAIGQSLHYSRMTGKQPGVVLIVDDDRYTERIRQTIEYHDLNIRLWLIPQ